MTKLLVINGPNAGTFGWREPELYGTTTLAEIEESLRKLADHHKVDIELFQSDYEGAILERIHAARGNIDVIIINPAGLTYRGEPTGDAIKAVEIPTVEIHITNVYRRFDAFLTGSVNDAIGRASAGQITGFGAYGYQLAFYAALNAIGFEATMNVASGERG